MTICAKANENDENLSNDKKEHKTTKVNRMTRENNNSLSDDKKKKKKKVYMMKRNNNESLSDGKEINDIFTYDGLGKDRKIYGKKRQPNYFMTKC